MKNYIFIDNWVCSYLRKPYFFDTLKNYILANQYTVLLSSLSLVELYNPGWKKSSEADRTQLAVSFYSSVPCVIVYPPHVWDAELQNCLDPVDELPYLLDLRDIDDKWRKEALLRFLRADDLYVSQSKDIRVWVENYCKIKEKWLSDVDDIIEHAIENGNLERSNSGSLCNLSDKKEMFLLSLDLRLAPPENIDKILSHYVQQTRQRTTIQRLSSVRMSSLVFWYLYVDIDPSNKIKMQGSDIGDIFHLSLIPYCKTFTLDKSMNRLIQRVKDKEPYAPIGCRLLTKSALLKLLGLVEAVKIDQFGI